jgi:hypothetical protein
MRYEKKTANKNGQRIEPGLLEDGAFPFKPIYYSETGDKSKPHTTIFFLIFMEVVGDIDL